MNNYTRLWSFRTAHFAVVLEAALETDPDLSWADAETLDKLERGIYQNVSFRVRVLRTHDWKTIELGCDYLGNSVYEQPATFRTEHIGERYGTYFTDMVRNAIREARETLTAMPRVRGAWPPL